MNLETMDTIRRYITERDAVRAEMKSDAGGGRHHRKFWPHRISNLFTLNFDDLKSLDKLYFESLKRRETHLTSMLAEMGYEEN